MPTTKKQATEPSDLYDLFERAIAAADVHGLVELYEPEAAVVPQPGQMARGAAEIQSALAAFASAVEGFSVRPTKTVVVGDIALLSGSWTASAQGPDGTPIPIGGADAVVARRGTDGVWRMVIDDANFVS